MEGVFYVTAFDAADRFEKGRVSGYILYPNSTFLFFLVLRTVFDDCLYST